MKTVVGFSFTDNPVQRLTDMGFRSRCTERAEECGYREFLFPLSPHEGKGKSFEIREIIDEDLYFRFQKRRDFIPFEAENANTPGDIRHPNSVFCIQDILTADMEPGHLKEHLFLRKKHALWALCLKCETLSSFKPLEQSDKVFKWQNQKALLIPLGPSCFDLLISP